MKIVSFFLVLCLCLTGCGSGKRERIVPTRSTEPILSTQPVVQPDSIHTPVYVTIFGNTAYLSTFPQEKLGEEEPECKPRNIAKGGSILCGCAHLKETPIARVVILDRIYPDSTANWFRNMGTLRAIDGMGNLNVDQVTNMSNMFRGCTKLAGMDIEHWNVGSDVDMTGMFNGCDAWGNLPSWYQE